MAPAPSPVMAIVPADGSFSGPRSSANPFADNGPTASPGAFAESTGAVDPSGHVLSAVGEVRDAATQGVSPSGAASVGAGLGIDVSLHVLPAVGRAAGEMKAALAALDAQSRPALDMNADGDPASTAEPAPVPTRARGADARPADDHGLPTASEQGDADEPNLPAARLADPQPAPLARRGFTDQLRDAAAARRPTGAKANSPAADRKPPAPRG
jgi:hypothetical protein